MPMTRCLFRVVPCLGGGNASAICHKALVIRPADVPAPLSLHCILSAIQMFGYYIYIYIYMPVPVKTWLERWSAESIPGTAALAAVLRTPPSPAQGPSPAHRFLQATARQAGQEFFAHDFAAPLVAPGLSFAQIQQRANQSSSLLLGIMERSRPLPPGTSTSSHRRHERAP